MSDDVEVLMNNIVDAERARIRAERARLKEERKARRRADKARSDAAREERIASLESRIRGGKAYCTCGVELKYGGTTCRPCFLAKASANQIAKREAKTIAQHAARIAKIEAKRQIKPRCDCGSELKYGGTMCRPCFLAKAAMNKAVRRDADVAARRELRIKKAEARKAAKAAKADWRSRQAAERTKPKRHYEQPMPRSRQAPPPAPSSVCTADPWVAIRARTYGKPPLVEGAIRPLTKFEMMTGRRERAST